jgi:hypothetical protein
MSMDITCIKLEFAILWYQNTLHEDINLSMWNLEAYCNGCSFANVFEL